MGRFRVLSRHRSLLVSALRIPLLLVLGLLLSEGILRALGARWQGSRKILYTADLGTFPEAGTAGYEKNRVFEKFKSSQDDSRPLIVTVGDSYTNGGNVPSYWSYPYFLHEEFRRSGAPASVLNLGACESPSHVAFRNLQTYLDSPGARKPQLAVLLVGASDLFGTLYRPEYLSKQALSGEGDWTTPAVPRTILDIDPDAAGSLGGWLSGFRLAKLVRNFWLNRALNSTARAKDSEQLLRDFPAIEQSFSRLIRVLPGPAIPELESPTAGFSEARKILESYPETVEPHEPDSYRTLASGFLTIRVSKHVVFNERDQAVETILSFAERYPLFLFEDPMKRSGRQFDTISYIYYLTTLFPMQSKLTAEAVLSRLKRIGDSVPELRTDAKYLPYRRLVELYGNLSSVQARLESDRAALWRRISRFSAEKDIRLLLVNYPADFTLANEALGRAARENGIPLVDANAAFRELGRTHKQGELYSFSDDHLTPLGYSKLATLVFQGVAGNYPEMVRR